MVRMIMREKNQNNLKSFQIHIFLFFKGEKDAESFSPQKNGKRV